jgi:hypothetical protein
MEIWLVILLSVYFTLNVCLTLVINLFYRLSFLKIVYHLFGGVFIFIWNLVEELWKNKDL